MERVIVYKEPANPVSEAYRVLCTNVLVGQVEKRMIEVVSVAKNNNASLVVANLAVAMAQAGKSILLVDCNLRTPQQHVIFDLQNNGLTDCINSGVHYKRYVQATQQTNLFVLTAGSAVANPVETLLSAGMQKMLTEARETYDMVLLDVPSVDEVSDAISLGVKTDGVLFVLANKQNRVEQAQKAKEKFLRASAVIIGCVIDKVEVI